jgi:Cu/Ag efflux pump CusA
MLNKIIAWALAHRPIVIVLAVMVLVYGGIVARGLPVDVFPDLNRPVVTIMTETEGSGARRSRTLVTVPIETSMNGATGVERVRSSSAPGLSIVYVEFAWGTDIIVDRQIVNEKLAGVGEQMPEGITPQLAPISSIMGEIMLISVSSKSGETSPLELRTIADWVIRPRLLSVSGVSQVISLGGGRKQFQVLIDPAKLRQFRVSVEEVRAAVAGSNINSTGGFVDRGGREFLVRNLGRAQSIEDIRATAIESNAGVPITVGQVAQVVEGAQTKRGDASANGRPAVISERAKTAGANTLQLTEQVERAIDDVRANLPADVVINDHQFRQSDFIEASSITCSMRCAMRAFWSPSFCSCFCSMSAPRAITVAAIPLSFLVAAIVFDRFDIGVNTMTLGGRRRHRRTRRRRNCRHRKRLRRLRENHHAKRRARRCKSFTKPRAKCATRLFLPPSFVALVFVPLFALSGMEGRLFAPLGIAYIVSLFASLLVSLTVTPVLASYLLPKSKATAQQEILIPGWCDGSKRVMKVLLTGRS